MYLTRQLGILINQIFLMSSRSFSAGDGKESTSVVVAKRSTSASPNTFAEEGSDISADSCGKEVRLPNCKQ